MEAAAQDDAPTNLEEMAFGEILTREPDLSQFDLLIPEVSASAGQLYIGLDTIDITQLHGLQFYWAAGYVGGHWPTFNPLCLAYPQLLKAGRLFSYAVSAAQDAEWCDCEAGDLSVAQVPSWLSRQFARGTKRPGVYANWDTWSHGGLMDQLAHYGPNIRRIVAHYTFVAQLAHPGFDAQQFTDRYANRNVDGNVALASLFENVIPPPEHHNPPHYERYATGPFHTQQWGALNERTIVEEYDGARLHPDKYKHYLPLLESKLQWLAQRVAHVAISLDPKKNGKPNWAPDWRGWRYQELIHRAHGAQMMTAT